jgi:hypothetical protein
LTLLDKKKDGVIDEDDLNQVFMSLGHKTKKGEIADMIWEVDEDCDNALNWKVRRLHRSDTLAPAQTSTLDRAACPAGISPSTAFPLQRWRSLHEHRPCSSGADMFLDLH